MPGALDYRRRLAQESVTDAVGDLDRVHGGRGIDESHSLTAVAKTQLDLSQKGRLTDAACAYKSDVESSLQCSYETIPRLRRYKEGHIGSVVIERSSLEQHARILQ
jgi:hypothetical protein